MNGERRPFAPQLPQTDGTSDVDVKGKTKSMFGSYGINRVNKK